jgi:hypothetical protein
MISNLISILLSIPEYHPSLSPQTLTQSLGKELVESIKGIPIGVFEDELVVDDVEAVDLRLEDVLLLLALVGRAHQSAGLPHRVHRPRHVLLVLVQRLQAILAVAVVDDQRLQLVQSEHDQEVEGDRGHVAHVQVGHVDPRLRHRPELLRQRKRHLRQHEPREEGVDPGHGRHRRQHHHHHSLHVVHHARLHRHHVVGRIVGRTVAVLDEVALLGLAEEGAAAVEGLPREQEVLLGQVIAFSHQGFVLGLLVLRLLDGLLGGGVGGVEREVEAEELDEAADVDDGQEHPNQHAVVE